MKKIILAVAFICMTSVAVNAQNLIKNGSFETWKEGDTYPTSWTGYKTVGVFSQVADAKDGKASLRVVFTPTPKVKARRINTTTVNLAEGTYEVSLFLKGKGDMRFVSLTLKGTTPASKTNETNLVGVPAIGKVDSDQWKEYKLTIDIKTAGQYMLVLGFNSGSDDKPFLVDDIKLVKK